MLVFDPAKFEEHQTLAKWHKKRTQENRTISQEDCETYISKNYGYSVRQGVQIVKPTFRPANFQIHFYGAIFL